MIQAKAVQSLADAHRRDLMASARPRRVARHDSMQMSDPEATRRSSEARKASGERGVHRVAPRLGTWLIGFGTRLGGTTVRTS